MGYWGKFTNQKETICPSAPMYHDLLPKCGRAPCICEITFPVAAVLKSIFCHNVYSTDLYYRKQHGAQWAALSLLCMSTWPTQTSTQAHLWVHSLTVHSWSLNLTLTITTKCIKPPVLTLTLEPSHNPQIALQSYENCEAKRQYKDM